MTKLILLRAINLARSLSCSIFEGRLAPKDHKPVFRQDGLSWKVLSTVVTLFWQVVSGRVASGWWSGASGVTVECMMLGFCVSLWCVCSTFLCAGNSLEAEAEQVATGTKENFTIIPSCTTRLSWISSSSLLFPSITNSSSLSSFFSSPFSSFSP